MAEEAIHFLCNNCQTKYAARIQQAGKEGECKQCGATIVVPQAVNANPETKKHKKRLKSLLPLVAGIAILTILVIVWVALSERQAVNEKRNKEIMTQKTLQRIQRDSTREHLKHILNKPFYTKHKFTIFLPLEWREIPGEILTLASKTAQEEYDISTFSKYDYGFQLSSNIEWFDYPYILIQVKKNRVSENEFKNTKKVKKGFSDAMDDFKEYLNISGIKTNEPIYDPNSKILWTSNEVKIDNKNIKTISGIILTEISTIQIYCYSLADEYDNYLPLFEQIIESIELSGDIRYVKQISDDYPILQNIDWSKVIASVIIGIVLSAFYSYRKKVKNNSLK